MCILKKYQAFTKIREMLATHKELRLKIEEMQEKTAIIYSVLYNLHDLNGLLPLHHQHRWFFLYDI